MGRKKFKQFINKIKERRLLKKKKKQEYKEYKKNRSKSQFIADGLLWYIGNTREKVITFIIFCIIMFTNLYVEINATDNITMTDNLISAYEMHNEYYNGDLIYDDWEKFLLKNYYGKYEKVKILLNICLYLQPEHINRLNLSAETEYIQNCYDFISNLTNKNELIDVYEYYQVLTIIDSGIAVDQTIRAGVFILLFFIISKIICAIVYKLFCYKFNIKGYSP